MKKRKYAIINGGICTNKRKRGHGKYGHCHKHFSTQNERKQYFDAKDYEDLYSVKLVRGKRTSKGLPNVWDDYLPTPINSKTNRKSISDKRK